MADTDQNEADVGRMPDDLRHVDDTLAFEHSRHPNKLPAQTPLVWIRDPNKRSTEPGRFYVTRDHDVIRTWAEALHGKPARLKSGAGGDVAEALRFEVTNKRRSEYDLISWDEWFREFDGADLVFIFQERTDDGAVSDLFRLSPASSLQAFPASRA